MIISGGKGLFVRESFFFFNDSEVNSNMFT